MRMKNSAQRYRRAVMMIYFELTSEKPEKSVTQILGQCRVSNNLGSVLREHGAITGNGSAARWATTDPTAWTDAKIDSLIEACASRSKEATAKPKAAEIAPTRGEQTGTTLDFLDTLDSEHPVVRQLLKMSADFTALAAQIAREYAEFSEAAKQ